jgi:hypothetical protein
MTRANSMESSCFAQARTEQKFQFRVKCKNREDFHGSDDAVPDMRKTNGSGCHPLRPHRPPMHKL